MTIDNLLKMADSTSTVVASSAAYVGSEINLGVGTDVWGTAATPNIGESGGLMWNLICEDQDFASNGSPVVTYTLRAATATGMASADTIATITTDKTPNDGDVIGRVWVPAGSFKQFMKMYCATTAALTAGKVTSWVGGVSETPK